MDVENQHEYPNLGGKQQATYQEQQSKVENNNNNNKDTHENYPS